MRENIGMNKVESLKPGKKSLIENKFQSAMQL